MTLSNLKLNPDQVNDKASDKVILRIQEKMLFKGTPY